MKVAVLGASNNPERYAYKAHQMLMEYGHEVFPVARKPGSVLGVTPYVRLTDIPEAVDTVTVYVGPQLFAGLVPDVLSKAPRRVILNPGTEDPAIEKALTETGIKVVKACTLVLLRTEQFELS
jgi:predicted CoA-binding protein